MTYPMSWKTFKARVSIHNPTGVPDSNKVPKGHFWFDKAIISQRTIDLSHEIFEFTKDEVLFSKQQVEKYGTNLKVDMFSAHFRDETKYQLHKKYPRGKVKYQIVVENRLLNLNLNWWNKFKLNVIHNRYWLFNEQKWFVTFLVSLLGVILAVISLATNRT